MVKVLPSNSPKYLWMISIPLSLAVNSHDYDSQIILIRIEFSLDSSAIVWHVKTFNWYWRKERLIFMRHGWIQNHICWLWHIWITNIIYLLKVSVEHDLNSPLLIGIIIWCCLRIEGVLGVTGFGVTGWRDGHDDGLGLGRMYGLLVGRVVVVVVIYTVFGQE